MSVAKVASVELIKASPEARLSLHYRCTLRIYCLEIGCHLEPIVHFQSLNIIFFLKIIGLQSTTPS
jgi:hypothetical protein